MRGGGSVAAGSSSELISEDGEVRTATKSSLDSRRSLPVTGAPGAREVTGEGGGGVASPREGGGLTHAHS